MEEELEGRDGKAQFLYDYLILDWFSFFFISLRVSDPDPQDPHVFALPGSGSGQKGKEMNE